MKRAQPVFEKRVALFFYSLLMFHFLLLAIYAFQPFVNNSFLRSLSKSYVEPLFTNNFKIFAPNVPTLHYSLFIRSREKGKTWSAWQNKTAQIEMAHRKNRFSAVNYACVLQQNAIRELLSAHADAEARKFNTSDDRRKFFRNSLHFYRAKYYLKQNYISNAYSSEKEIEWQCAVRCEPLVAIDSKNISTEEFLFFPVQTIQE